MLCFLDNQCNACANSNIILIFAKQWNVTIVSIIKDNMNASTGEIIVPKIREYLATQPITRAWLFGSFSRGEETENSDVDILVDFDKDARIGFFKYAGIYGDLKELLGREVDLVQNGALKAFAVESAEQDKILIYERAY